MRKFFLGALVALTVACSGGGDPTGPVTPVTPPSGTDPITPPPPPPPPTRTLVAKIYLLTSMSAFISDTTASMLIVRGGAWKDSMIVRGTATIAVPITTPDTVSFTLAGNAQYPTVVATVPKAFWDSQKDTIKIVRIPRKWTILSGVYAGMTVTADLIRPYQKNPADGNMFWRRAGNDTLGYWYPQLGWNLASFPAKIWIDSDSSIKSSGITPNQSDFNNLKVGIDSLSKILGWSPFATSVDSGLKGSIRAVIWNGPKNNGIRFDDVDNGYFGGLYLATSDYRFVYPGVTIHEMFHILGFDHTCAWSGRTSQGCVWTNPKDESYMDIAYLEIWFGVNNVRRMTGAQYHFGENLNGSLLELGRPIDRIAYDRYATFNK